MTITPAPTTTSFLDRATAVGQAIAPQAERHDRDGTFVVEAVEALRDAGLLAMGVPVDLGGGGASVAEIAAVQRELGHHCGSTALASAMHQHVVAFTAWRYRRGLSGAEATLRRVADEGIVLVSTGGADQTHPRGQAVRVEGGYRVSGRKVFCSQSPAGAAMSTMFAYEDPEHGLRVLNMAVPLSADGVTVLDDWDVLGMRGTGSNSVVVDDVFVAEDKVMANRPHGVIDGPLQVIFSIAFPIITAAYLGVAEAAFAAAVEAVGQRRDDVTVQRQIGLMADRLRVAGWALDGALAAVGEDPQPSMDLVVDVMAAKREVALAGIEVCDLAMDVAGGAAFSKGTVIERCYRDIRAIKCHPLSLEKTLVHAGRVALGVPADDVL